MSLRWLWIAIVLALAAGNAAGAAPPAPSRGEEVDALDGAGLLPPHAQRSSKRIEAPRRDARRISDEHPPAPPPPAPAVIPPRIATRIAGGRAAASGGGRTAGSSALARASPGA